MGFIKSDQIGYGETVLSGGPSSILNPDVSAADEPFSEGLSPLDPGLFETMKATFRRYNVPTRAIESLRVRPGRGDMGLVEPVGGFDWYDPLSDMDGPPDDPEMFRRDPAIVSYLLDATSPESMAVMKSYVSQDISDLDIFERASGGKKALGIIGAFIPDPITYFAPLKLLSTGSLAKNMFLNAKRGGIYTAGQVTAQESILQATSPTMPLEESAIAMGIAPVAGFGVGGLFGAFAKGRGAAARAGFAASNVRANRDADALVERYLAEQADVSGRYYDPMTGTYRGGSEARFSPGIGDDPFFDPFARHSGTSVGVDPTRYPFGPGTRKPSGGRGTSQPDLLGNPSNIGAVSNALGIVSVGYRTITSYLASTVDGAQRLVESGVITKRATLGIANKVPVETKVKAWSAALAERTADVRKSWVAYRMRIAGDGKAPKTAFGTQISDLATRATGGKVSGLSKAEFNREITEVARGGTSDIKEVMDIAQFIREDFDLLHNEAVKVGLLDKGQYIENYIPRLWNVSMVREREQELISLILNWQKENLPKAQRDSLPTLRAKLKQIYRSPDGLERGVLEADEVLQVKAAMKEAAEKAPTGRKGPLKERTIEVDDKVISDFISNDIDQILRSYWRLTTADIEIVREFGDLRLSKTIKGIRADASKMSAKPRYKGKAEEIKKRAEADIKDLEGMRDIIRGVYGIPEDPYSISSRSARLALEFNNLISLGGATISSLPDIARIPMVAGMATIPMLKTLVTDFSTFKIAASEVLKAGTALDLELNTRAIALTATGDLPERFTRPEKALGYATNAFFLANLLSPWNSFIKRAAGTAIGHEILELSEQWAKGTISQSRRTKMANAYISEFDARDIAKQFSEHGDTVNGLRIPNTSNWTDENAVKKFRAALVHDVDTTIVTPGVGDQPLFAHKIWGRLITQYKSFLFAAATRVAVPALQQKDARTMLGVMMMIFAGGLVSNFKDRQNGRQPSQDVFDFVFDGIDQSGVTSWFMSINQGIEALSDNTFGIRPMLGTAAPYGSSTAWKIGQFSPVAGKAFRASEVAGDYLTGDVNSWTRRKAWSIVPGNNLFYVKPFRDMRLNNVFNFSSWVEQTSGGDAEAAGSQALEKYSKNWRSRLETRLSDSLVAKGLSRSKAESLAATYAEQIVENRKKYASVVPKGPFKAKTSETVISRDEDRLSNDSAAKLRKWRKSLLNNPGNRSRDYLMDLISKIDAKLD